MRHPHHIILSLALAAATTHLSLAAIPPAGEDNQRSWLTQPASLPPLPHSHGVSGAWVGLSGDNLVVAGGSWFDGDDRPKIYGDSVYVFDLSRQVWIRAGTIPFPVAHGASVEYQDGMLCMGGENSDGPLDKVEFLKWDKNAQALLTDGNYPPLPRAAAKLSAAVADKSVYVLSGSDFWRMKPGTRAWETLEMPPFGPWDGVVMLSQSNGVNDCLWFFGGKEGDGRYSSEAWFYDPSQSDGNRWRRLPDSPYPLSFSPAIRYGSSQLFIFSGSAGRQEFPVEILSFNTITNAWYDAGTMRYGIAATGAVASGGTFIIPSGEIRPKVRTNAVQAVSIKEDKTAAFQLADYIALTAYLLLIVLLSVSFSKKTKSSKDFFLGGQKIPFWAAGLSLMAAQVSSIGFMSIPAKSFATNWSYFAGVLTWFVVVPIVIHVFVPFYRKLNVTSAYEYLEKRFNRFIRKFVAFLYLLFQLLGRLGALIFLPAIALYAVTGINPLLSIVIIGGLATLYTVLGGMKAVIWIDVIQAIVLFGAIFICIGFVIGSIDGGVDTIFKVAADNGKFSFGRRDWDITVAGMWIIIIGNIFNRLGSNATDQSVVQRYLTTKDEKATAKALWTDALVSVPWALCVFGLGTALWVFYKLNPGMLLPSVTNDEIVPFFIGQNLPAGLRGIVIAGIFAASMSSVDSSIHSSTTVLMQDFLGRLTAGFDERRKVLIAKAMTFVIGTLGTMIAAVMTVFDINSVWDIILEAAGLFTGAMTGVFLLGIFSRKANGPGAVVGAFASAAVLLAVKTWTPVNFFLYSGIGILTCFVTGLLASLCFRQSKPMEGLTIYTVKSDNQ